MKTCSECKITKELKDFSPKRGQCKPCRAAYSSKYRKENKETVNASNKQYRSANREATNGYSAKWAKANPEQCCIQQKRYAKRHPDRVAARLAKRRAAKKQRTPKWLTGEHLKEIQQFYTEAKELQWLSEQPLEVDHIVPLQGKNVSGLHVPWNLQILPKPANCSKGNRL